MRRSHLTSALFIGAALLLASSCTAVADSATPDDAAERELLKDVDPATLSQLLHWSLENQDLGALATKAEQLRSGAGELPSPDESGAAPARPAVEPLTAERKADLRQMFDEMMPNQVEMMQTALALAVDETAAVDEREQALHDLQELVEDVDNARDFQAIDGFGGVAELLVAADGVSPLQAAAAWVVGTAVQNQRELQLHLLELQVLPSLLRLLSSHADLAVRAKALFALSGLLSNCDEARAQYEAEGGIEALLSALADPQPKLVTKALVLLTDLLRTGGGGGGEATLVLPLPNATRLCDAVAQGLRLPSWDAKEKAAGALGEVLAAGILSGGGGSGCAPELRAALEEVRAQCDEEVCEELLPLLERLDERLEEEQLI